MRWLATIILFFTGVTGSTQNNQEQVLMRMKKFHELMVADRFYIDQYVDDSLSYGHSNGWIENKKDFLSNLGGKIIYHSIKEDSTRAGVHDRLAHIRFTAVYDATMDGKRNQYHLRVLEVWVKKKKTWRIFARQAVKI